MKWFTFSLALLLAQATVAQHLSGTKPSPKEKNKKITPKAKSQKNETDAELEIYSGHFVWYPEGYAEGSGNLSLKYNGDKTFSFSMAKACNEQGIQLEGTLYVNRSQHAFYQNKNCFIHFNFLMGDTVEVIEEYCNKSKKNCRFSGDYVRQRLKIDK